MNIKIFTVSAITLAAIAFTANTQAATASGAADATVLAPITIAAADPLSFGKFVNGASGGTVVVTTAGTRSATGTVVLSTAGAGWSDGTFTVTGETDATFSISIPGTVTLDETGAGTATMTVTTFSDLTGTTATSTAAGNVTTGTLTAGTQTIHVGGELAVGATQLAAAYAGTYDVVVEYN